MSNFNQMEYSCLKALDNSDQKAIDNFEFHHLHHLFPDTEVSYHAVDAFSKYLETNFECIDTTDADAVDDLAMFVAGIVSLYLSARSMAGYSLAMNGDDMMMKAFKTFHGGYLVEYPESWEAHE